ncbi:MAG: hypothetical protein RI964_2356 [Pseudomonadota bacterium]|jgi:hypothetical protein
MNNINGTDKIDRLHGLAWNSPDLRAGYAVTRQLVEEQKRINPKANNNADIILSLLDALDAALKQVDGQ